EGLGFAIPANVVSLVYQQLRAYGCLRRGEIGAAVQDTTPELVAALNLPSDSGVVVSDVIPGSAADVAGLKVRDQMVRVDDQSGDSLPDFNLALLRHSQGQLKLLALRGSQKLLIDVAITHGGDDAEGPQNVWIPVLHDLFEGADPVSDEIAQLGVLG